MHQWSDSTVRAPRLWNAGSRDRYSLMEFAAFKRTPLFGLESALNADRLCLVVKNVGSWISDTPTSEETSPPHSQAPSPRLLQFLESLGVQESSEQAEREQQVPAVTECLVNCVGKR